LQSCWRVPCAPTRMRRSFFCPAVAPGTVARYLCSAKTGVAALQTHIDKETNVATMWLCNGRKTNPLSASLMKDMIHELDCIRQNRSVRCVLLRHEGPWFSSGHDLHDLFDKTQNWVARPRVQLEEAFATCSDLNLMLRSLPQPTVAVVQGHASAGGVQLVASCDIVIASTDAQFSAPGSQRGRFCHTPGVAIAARTGERKALELLLLGSVWSAADAEQFGLVNFVVKGEDLEDKVAQVALCLAKSSRNIEQGKKRFYELAAGSSAHGSTEDGSSLDSLRRRYRMAERHMVDVFCTPDAAEGTRAMVEKREPQWTDQELSHKLD